MSERTKEEDRERSQFWKDHLDQWSRSGITQNAYCRANDLKSNRMTYWKTKFKRQSYPVEFVQISPARISQLSQPREVLRLNVDLGFQIEIPDGFSKNHIDPDTTSRDLCTTWIQSNYRDNLPSNRVKTCIKHIEIMKISNKILLSTVVQRSQDI